MANKACVIFVGCALGVCANISAALAQPPKHGKQVVSDAARKLAQQTGEIDGAVHTLAGNAISGAAVQVLNADGSTRATLNADATGHFRIQLPAGTYAVVVGQMGYVRLRIGNVIVSAGRSVPLNFSLTIMPPTALSGAILHNLPGSIGAPNPHAAPPPPPPPPPLLPAPKINQHPPDVKPAPEPEQVILLHAQPATDNNPVAVTAPPPPTPAPENAADASAAAQASAAVEGEQQQQKAVEDFVKSLPKGLISYLVPSPMHLNQPVTVSVKIFGAKAPAALAEASGGTSPEPVPTSNYMQVYLSQEDNPGAFTIEPEGDQNPRWVSSAAETDWNWTVTPKTTGTAKLRFQTLVMFPDQAGKLPATYDVRDETVTVTTPSVGEYLHGAWDAFLTNPAVWFEYVLPGGTGFLILGWLISRFKKKKRKKAAS